MGEFVEQSLEVLLPVFEQLSNVQLLSAEEVQGLIKRCRRYEYRLQKREKSEQDFLLYGDYLNEFVSFIQSRRIRQEYWHKIQLIEKPIQEKIASLYRRCCDRFQSNINNWRKLLDYLKTNNMRKQMSRAYTRVLQVHGRNVCLRVESALWEFFSNASADNARSQLQLAIRMCPEEYKFYDALFHIEIHYVSKILARRNYLRSMVNKVRKEKKDSENEDSDVDDSVFDVDVDDAVLQLRVAEVVIHSALKNVDEDKIGEMLLSMWNNLRECPNLIADTVTRLQDLLENNITKLNNEYTQLFYIKQAEVNKKDLFSVYEDAIHNMPTDKMYRLFLEFCDERISLEQDPLAEIKKAELFVKMIERGWTSEKDMINIVPVIQDVVAVGDKKLLLEKALKGCPSSVALWAEWLQHRMNTTTFDSDEKIKNFSNELNSAFLKVASDESYPLWEITLEFTMKNIPEQIEQVFERAIKTACAPVASKIKLLRLDYLKALMDEKKISELELKNVIIQMLKQKPNEPLFYLNVARWETEKDQIDQNLSKMAYDFAINEHGANSIDSWLDYIRFALKYQPNSVGHLYKRAMMNLDKTLCPIFIESWTSLQKEVAENTLKQEKLLGKRQSIFEESLHKKKTKA